jgi:hypothetical protein
MMIALTLILCSWGANGHYYISYRSTLFMTPDLLSLQNWAYELSFHASDADDRKDVDPSEAPKHYINYEVFPGFNSTGKVIQDVDSANLVYGAQFLDNNGYLPYATINTFNNLVDAFQRNDDADIIFYASDLGHYVGDGHMPLHLTENYNGQLTGQSGVHSRIESNLVNEYISEINTSGGTIHYIDDVNTYIFNYQYASFAYVDSLLADDANAYGVSHSYYSSSYYPALWNCSKKQINRLFHNASQALADLIFTAAVRGGQPVSGIESRSGMEDWKVYPNPVSSGGALCITRPSGSSPVLTEIYDESGRCVMQKRYSGQITTMTLPDIRLKSGIYFLKLETENSSTIRRIVVE